MSNSKELLGIIKDTAQQGTKPFDTEAEVIRVEGDTVWVHMPAGVDETPVQKTINAKVGDIVQVRVANGSAWLVGNTSAPPTDDTRANRAQVVAMDAGKKAVKAEALAMEAQDTANQADMEARAAIELIGDTPQFFWHEEEGTDTGSHITEIPKEAFKASPSGGNTLIRSTGVAIRQALTELALFMSNLIRLGPSNGKNVTIDTDSVDIMDSTTQLATFGATTRIGPSAGRNVSIGSSTVDVNNGSTNYASFGATTRIGEASSSHITMSSSNMLMYDNENKETVRIQSGGSIAVPTNEAFQVLSQEPSSSTLTYTTPELRHTPNWTNGLSIALSFKFALSGDTVFDLATLNLSSASSTATATVNAPSGSSVVCKVTASYISGNMVRLAFTNLAPDIVELVALARYQYDSTFNYIRVRGNVPQLSFYNDLGTATSYIRAYNGGEYGNNLVFQSGGNVFLGGGEYANNRYSYDHGETVTEDAFLGADGTVYIESGANTIANRKTWAFNSDGTFTFPSGAVFNTSNYITGVNFGDSTNTDAVWFWGNSTNKVAIGARVNPEGVRYNFVARENSIRLFADNVLVWAVSGLADTINLGAIGTVSQVSPAAVSVASGTVKNVASRSLAAGTWLVIGSAEFATNATGRRAIQLATTTTGDAIQLTARDVQSPVSGAVTLCNFTTIIQPTATTTYYLNAYQNSGSALNVTPQLQCIRIK